MNLTLMESVYNPIKPSGQLSMDWDDVAWLLSNYNNVRVKEETPLFNFWQFKTIADGAELGRKYHDKTKKTWDELPGTIRRCANNGIGLSGMVIDYDGKKTIEDAALEMSDYEFVVYTTFNHSSAVDKFRLVIPFTRMMPSAEFRSKRVSMKDKFPAADPASFSESQAIYLHSGLHSDLAITFQNHGKMIDPDIFDVEVDEPRTHSKVEFTGELSDFYRDAVVRALTSCKNIHYAHCLTVGAICKSIGLSEGGFNMILDSISEAGSSSRAQNVRSQLWQESMTAITAAKRDKFLVQHGGMKVADAYDRPKHKNPDAVNRVLQKLKGAAQNESVISSSNRED